MECWKLPVEYWAGLLEYCGAHFCRCHLSNTAVTYSFHMHHYLKMSGIHKHRISVFHGTCLSCNILCLFKGSGPFIAWILQTLSNKVIFFLFCKYILRSTYCLFLGLSTASHGLHQFHPVMKIDMRSFYSCIKQTLLSALMTDNPSPNWVHPHLMPQGCRCMK